MRERLSLGSTRTGRLTGLLATAALSALMLSGLAAASASAETTWLCKPGLANNPCESNLTSTTVLSKKLSFVEPAKPAANPPIDCFYVYPTVSEQLTPNANLEIEPEETQIAIDQASRFSQVCKMYAPVYNQVTLAEANGFLKAFPPPVSPFPTVLAAFEEYLAKYNNGRGFVLIGHSQGSGQLEELIATTIEGHSAVKSKMVSALILGGGVTVPNGKDVGGTFKETPTCQTTWDTHCVIAYSTFYKEPPESPGLGRTPVPGEHIVCVNPALFTQNGGSGVLDPYESTTPFPGQIGKFQGAVPTASTPWVSTPGEYTAQCHTNNGAGWLQLTPQGEPVDPPEFVQELLPPSFGLHLFDVNIALGNLVPTVAVETAAYELGKLR
jgi:Protein of unknown function (DUF3089)